jgi:5-methyltetrahydrofolate--homocysteine methyltransferase
MEELIQEILVCIERGKVDAASPYPPDMRGQEGADELAKKAIAGGAGPDQILKACEEGMDRIGEKFGKGQAFVPELLMSAKAMKAVMVHLKPFFASGSVKAKGTFVIGTVAGDLHDIGKNLVAMVVEGGGWKVLDLGVDVKPAKFLDAVAANPGCVVGLSALLTTTMAAMEKTIQELKAVHPGLKIIVGGAPLTPESARRMGADGYGRDPRSALQALEGLAQAS